MLAKYSSFAEFFSVLPLYAPSDTCTSIYASFYGFNEMFLVSSVIVFSLVVDIDILFGSTDGQSFHSRF